MYSPGESKALTPVKYGENLGKYRNAHLGPIEGARLGLVQDRNNDVWKALRACRLWRSASDEGVDRLVAIGRVATFKRAETLATEGDPADRFAVIVVGRVKVFHLSADGHRMTYEDLGSGEPMGAVAALAGGRLPANAEAATDGSVVWLTQDAVFDLMEAETNVGKDVVHDLASRVVDFTSVVQSLALDVPSRLSRYLFEQALAVGETTPDGLLVDLGMSKGELAAALGTVPETLSRAFPRLREEDVLEVRGRTILIFDVGALARSGSGYE